jgi:chromosome segregation ATPase
MTNDLTRDADSSSGAIPKPGATIDLEEANRRLAEANTRLAKRYAELEERTSALEAANTDLAKANAQAADLMSDLDMTNAENKRLNRALSRSNALAAELMADLETKNEQLRISLAEIKTLQGIIPICAHCKQVRDDEGFWDQVESYLSKNSDLAFSHGICPTCCEKYYSEYLTEEDKEALRKGNSFPADA